ncbi:uncharacterized protein T551_00525 [Pneumocystis jirovecii RU7]|uniref:Uncharacterized protein n=1 Tax=Pneumocystis jirovecii (strain RU7) TaxID=1408657 RepID=A0A0W4ZVN4_PNEJ7|nr:uncharacterized protein T551_00525 [Pneumocystis jirovecii RU7]KTW32435.1 hypothetical protein T551_00525 [Pneumocystis jirovecii RU7]
MICKLIDYGLIGEKGKNKGENKGNNGEKQDQKETKKQIENRLNQRVKYAGETIQQGLNKRINRKWE